MCKLLLFFFIIVDPDGAGWRVAPAEGQGYATYAECKEGQNWYRMMEEIGTFSECYAKGVR